MSAVPLTQAVGKDDDGTLHVRIAGELDMETAPELTELVTAALQLGERRIALDLSGVTFIGSTGLTALLTCHRDAQLLSAVLTLRDPSRRVVDLLVITGLDTLLPIDH